MGRLALLLIGILMGAAGVYLAFDRGLLTTRQQQAANASALPAAPADSAPNDSTMLGMPDIDGEATMPPDATDESKAGEDVASLSPPGVVPQPTLAMPRQAAIEALPALTPPPVPPLLVPVQGVATSALADTFEQNRGAGRRHDAIDIMAPRGTPVLAVDDGVVAKLFASVPGGLTLYQFDPQQELAYYYAHLDSYAPGMLEGKLVKKGELIGHVGSTGNAAPNAPHLHFAVFVLGPEKNWWQGTAINPYPLLVGKSEPAPVR